jgi:hypothetical protein
MDYKVEVDETNTVRVYEIDSADALILQEKKPDGSDWANAAEAEAWGAETAAMMQANKDAHAAMLAELAESEPAEETPAEEDTPTE